MLPSQRKKARENLRADILKTIADLALGLMGVVWVLLAFFFIWVATPK